MSNKGSYKVKKNKIMKQIKIEKNQGLFTRQKYLNFYKRIKNQKEKIKKKIVKEGELLFTGPMIDHAMLYTKETELLVMSKNPRDQKTYEEDTVRIDFMDHSRRF